MSSYDAQDSLSYYRGKLLTRDIYTRSGLLLVQAGTVLDDKVLQHAVDHGCPIQPEDVRQSAFVESQVRCTQEIEKATVKVQEYFDEIRLNQKVPLHEIRRDIMPHIAQATEHPHLFGLLSTLQAKDDYTYRHNIGVGVLAALLGKWLGLGEDELSELTMAATLHDIGKMKIPLEILNKPGPLTEEEFALIKKHPEFGLEMLKETPGANDCEKLVALQHHERLDGSGYPNGIRGEQMHYYSKIVAVCDVYHAMSSRRAYHEPSPFYIILEQMMQNRFGELDAHIVGVFIDKMMAMMVGNDVRLSDGTVGSIVLVHPNEPFKPLVKVGTSFIDMRQSPDLKIEQVLA